MWEPSQATSDKDINGLVLLASAGCRLFGERTHRETVYVLCGGKGTAPGCALHGSPKVPSVGFLSRRESVNVIQISIAQGPVDTVADLLPQSQDTKSPKKAEGTSQSSLDCTALTEHATLLLNSIIQKYQRSTGPQHMRGCYTSHRWRRILAGLYLPVRIRQELQQPAGLTRPETWLDQVD